MGHKQKVLILSPLRKGNGNYTTVDRIRKHLISAGHSCDLCDPCTVMSQEAFMRRLEADHIDVLVGIHAFKTGPVMRASGLPYMLIFGGTDIHVFCDDPDKMAAMTLAVNKARYVICFSESNKERAMKLWPHLPKHRVKVISQAVETSPSDFHLISHLRDVRPDLACLSHAQLRPFVLVGGIRPVKNPLYLIESFQEWHKIDRRVLLVIIGHKLDEEYCSQVIEPAIEKWPGVVHVPGLPICDVHAAMSQATALVNSSDSEGMCLSILEAMCSGTAVLARDIPANRAIVTHGHTGLLFNSPEQFVEMAVSLVSDDELRQGLIGRARSYVREHHDTARESLAYLSLLNQCSSVGDIVEEVHVVDASSQKPIPNGSTTLDSSEGKARLSPDCSTHSVPLSTYYAGSESSDLADVSPSVRSLEDDQSPDTVKPTETECCVWYNSQNKGDINQNQVNCESLTQTQHSNKGV